MSNKSKDFQNITEKEISKAFTSDIKSPPESYKTYESSESPPQPPYTANPSQKSYKSSVTPEYKPMPPLEIDSFVGLDGHTAEKLRKGNISINTKLDLHGYKIDEAFEALNRIIAGCYQKKQRCLLIITGKGLRSEDVYNTIKYHFPRWVNLEGLREKIIAVCHATHKHGGEGAFYIYLRKEK